MAGLRRASATCRACDLWKHATQTVFGEGPSRTQIVLVGEQPGDKEDLACRPFVGPAGKLLDEALTEAGIKRSEVYITNVVKHFKWAPSSNGKTRTGKKPLVPEINACRPWLNAELDHIKPKVLICLGATAAQSLLGRNFSITRQRGRLVPSPLAPKVMATLHPSAILRSRGKQLRKAQMQAFIRDLTQAAHFLKETS
jgi:DNA polymerase